MIKREQAPSMKAQRRWFQWVPLTFPQKLLMLLLIAVVTPTALSVFAFSEIMHSYMKERSSYDGRSLVSVLATSLSGQIEGDGWDRADRVLMDYLAADDSVAFICVTDADGSPIHMSVHESEAWDRYIDGQQRSFAEGHLDVTRRVTVSTVGDGLVIRTVPVYAPETNPDSAKDHAAEAEGYIVLGIHDVTFAAAAKRFQLTQVVISAAATLIIAPLILFAYFRWTGPLRQMRASVIKLTDGQPPEPMVAKEDDDVGRLVQAVNRMSGSVLAAQRQLRDANFNLEELVKQRTVELREAVRELEQLSTTDVLTGLANRRAFYRQLEDDFARASVYRGELTVLMIDLDGFKQVNDTFGHDVGDEVLIIAAESIISCCDSNTTPARLGGDELVVLIRHLSEQECSEIAQRISETFVAMVDDRLVRFDPRPSVTMSIGLASLRETSAAGSEILMAMADMALYSAKSQGRSRLAVFNEAMAAARLNQHEGRRAGDHKEAA